MLHVVADIHAIHRSHPCRAGLAGPLARLGDVGVGDGEPPAGFGDLGADQGANLGGQRRGVIPTLHVSRPLPRGSLDDGNARVSCAHGRIAETQRRDGLLDREQSAGLQSWRVRVVPLFAEHLGAQILQQRTAVVQQQLTQHRGHQVAAARTDPVTPPGEGVDDLMHRVIDGFLAEDLVGQLNTVEGSEPMQRVDAGQQIAEGEDVRPDRAGSPARFGGLEPFGGGPEQVQPLLARPPPVGRLHLGAAQQYHRDRVIGSAPMPPSVRLPQRISRIVQRPQQPGDRMPPQRVTAAVVSPTQIRSQASQRILFRRAERPGPVVTLDVDRPQPGRGDLVAMWCGACRWAGCHDCPPADACAPDAVSMSIRHAWICSIPRASLSARSRPDRWM